MVASTRRRRAGLGLRPLGAVLVSLVLSVAAGCSGDSNDDAAARNSSNFNTRSIVAFGGEVPVPPDARFVTRGAVKAGAWHRTYEVSLPAADVLAYYEQELPSKGWTGGATPEPTPGGAAATWRRRGLRLDITVAPAPAGSTPSTPTTGASAVSTVNLTLQKVGGA
jgi:hypothetical protein